MERALNKAVKIQSIDFHFPWDFDLSGVEVRDKRGIFNGELCFAVDKIHLTVSPASLSQKSLVIDLLDVAGGALTVRKREGRLYHILSDTMMAKPSATALGAGPADKPARGGDLPFVLSRFLLKNGKFRLIDYDVSPEGFVVELDQITASVKEVHLPPARAEKTSYQIQARLAQGRDQKPAGFELKGWTDFFNRDTDALLSAEDLHLPYFEPYLAQVSQANIREGFLSSRVSVRIQNNDLNAAADFEVNSLYFGSYELGDQLFGLKADEILSFLKDSSGVLKFQIVTEWNIADKKVDKRAVIRKSIERSLKKTVLGNLGTIIENTVRKIGEKGLDSSREDVEGALKKVKDLFR